MPSNNAAKTMLEKKFGTELTGQIQNLSDENAKRLATVISNPMVKTSVNRNRAPYGATLHTNYGSVSLDDSLAHIESLYINGQRFGVNDDSMTGVEKATGNAEDIESILGEPEGRQHSGRRNRRRMHDGDQIDVELAQRKTLDSLSKSHLKYETLFEDLNGLMDGSSANVSDITDEIFSHNVDEKDLPDFLVYKSSWRNSIVSQVNNIDMGVDDTNYDFKPQQPDDSFVGKLMTRLNVHDAEYDRDNGVLKVGDRMITNIPDVDEKGVFHNGDTAYIPYYNGYFAAGEGSRVDRLRAVDPVESSLDGLALQFKNTKGDVKFKTILDVSRNLPDFDKHPYGDELLDTYKHKLVLNKDYEKTNSLLEDYNHKADNLGAVATTILDDDARGLIDPLGTSNGGNMGKIMFLTEGSEVNPDHTLTASGEEYSKVGKILTDYHVDRDNFNRNQMSFNALLTSTDVKEVNVAYGEFALWNAEDALVMTDKGAKTMFNEEKTFGDKVMDFHGNKSTTSLVIDSKMDPETAKEKHLTNAVKFAQMNPDLDMVVSPVSINSRLNMGVPHEALASGEKQDLHLPDGSTVKNGISKMMYMSLPQTAEHKSKDYAIEGNGRRYSTLLRYALASKVGQDMYDKAIIDPKVKQEHLNEVNETFNRLGIDFKNPDDLLKPGNVTNKMDAEVEVDKDDFAGMVPSMVRRSLMEKMEDGKININLGEMSVNSPITKQPIQDSFGSNVLPINVGKDGAIPYRYMDTFKALSLGNPEKLQQAYSQAVGNDYKALNDKDNLLKNIDTMTFNNEAHTDVLIPDPTLDLRDVRANVESNDVIIHRDPAIQSGNVMSMHNVKDGAKNVVQVNPLIEVMMDADNDGDTLGVVGYKNLRLNDQEKQEFFNKSSMEEQVNQYGNVFLETGDAHFKAAILANQMDDSNLNFADGKSNHELVDLVNQKTKEIVDSPKSYGAYALNFTDENSVKNSMNKLADDGIKGNKEDIDRIFEKGYTPEENKNVLKALIAKSEWTGLAGATTNNLISGLSGDKFDPQMVRTSMDVTHSMTQSVLQMKKNADKLPLIDDSIKQMKTVMSGKYDTEKSDEVLKKVTDGLIEPQAIDKFVTEISEHQDGKSFGSGVINNTPPSTIKAAYTPDIGEYVQDMLIDEQPAASQTNDTMQAADLDLDLSDLNGDSLDL